MAFNIHERIVNRDGMAIEDKAGPYQDQLLYLIQAITRMARIPQRELYYWLDQYDA